MTLAAEFSCLLTASAKTPAQAISRPPTALSLYRLSLSADSIYAYSGRKFLTEWREDDRVYASVEDISHAPPATDLTIYVAPRSSKGRQVLQQRNQFWTYVPQTKLLVHRFVATDTAPPEQSATFSLLLSNYTLKVSPKSTTVAGRKAFEISIKPIIAGRPYALLWIDPDTGVVLRREEYHSDGALASVSYYGEINFHPEFTSAEFKPQQWNGHGVRLVEQPLHADAPVATTMLPAPLAGKAVVPQALGGFALQKVAILDIDRKKTLHLLYSDGLNPLSLYEVPRGVRTPTRLPLSRRVDLEPGCVGHVSHQYKYELLTWDTPAMNYTLVSDMSAENLVKVAQATGTIRPAQHAATRR